jgi:uncharacterized membrane protein YhaH (DUF805 family)
MDFNAIIENFKNILTKHYFDFNGRTGRAEFWWYVLAYVVIAVVVGIIGSLIHTTILSSLLSLAFLCPNLGIAVRRLHDIDKTGWYVLLPMVPTLLAIVFLFMLMWQVAMILWVLTLACMILLIWWYAQPGNTGANKFGSPPAAFAKK